jgi:hypothetical protein
MATKKVVPKKVAEKSFRAKVRMYRQGLGDCFLITLPRGEGKPFYLLIDCGVILGTADPTKIMTEVVQDIVTTTGGAVDVLVATHEHWDHISGFAQAQEAFGGLKVKEVWLAWTEDPKDKLAKKLRGERLEMRRSLAAAAPRLRFGGDGAAAAEVVSMLQFFGPAAASTADALENVRKMAPSGMLRFCRPSDDPTPLSGTSVTAYVLGPPQDEKMIKKFNPSKKNPETYGMDSMGLYVSAMAPALGLADPEAPFDRIFPIPVEAARQSPFFQDRYWGEDRESEEKNQSWRAIDSAWLSSSPELAMQLDSATNNTSLVIALELDGGDVLLFAADAQVGNWLSWQDVKWKTSGGGHVTGPDLLRRTVLYKVGHHGSHNATLKEKGLAMMEQLQVALMPVNQEMAKKKGWDKIPLNELVKELDEVTGKKVVRIDKPLPPALKNTAVETKLFFELTV